MAGSFPGLPLAIQSDINGNPLGGCLLYVYQGGTTTPSSVFQDIGLTISAAWPLEGDASGRLPLFFVADGNYHLRLTDNGGVVVLDAPIVPSIGPSSTGSSGGAVDPTTVFSTGDVKWQPIQGQIVGWVRCNHRTIGSATSGASELASATAQNLFTFLWTNFDDTICPVVGGRGVSALADWSANKQITLLNLRGFVLGGVSDMGGVDTGAWSGVPFSRGNGTTAAALVGETLHTMLATEMPIHTHTANFALPSASLTNPTPTLTNPTPSLTLPSATLSLPSASFAGNAFTPSGTVSASGSISATTDAQKLVSSNAAGTGAGNVALTTGAVTITDNRTWSFSGTPGTPSGNVTLSGGSVSLSGGSVSLSGGSVSLSGGSVSLSGGSVTNQNAGGSVAHNNCQPTMLGTFYMKL